MKYRRKPGIVQAFELGEDDFPRWFLGGSHIYHANEHNKLVGCTINHKGILAHKGDMIIKGVHGELYVCKNDIYFGFGFEPVVEEE